MKHENRYALGKWMKRWIYLWVILGMLALILTAFIPTMLKARAASGDWTTYMADNGRSGYNPNETVINPSTAPLLKLKWTHTTAGTISTQPVEANSLIYWGSWDAGNEHATSLSNAHFYALDALTGKIIWNTSLGSSPSHFIWSSPAIYNGSVYIGMASFGDCPLVQGKMIQLNASTGAIQHAFNVVPNGCLGGGIWSSPTIDAAAGTIYTSTGNPGTCSTSEHYTIALVELSASDLSFKQVWQVPTSEQISDGDFGATPTL